MKDVHFQAIIAVISRGVVGANVSIGATKRRLSHSGMVLSLAAYKHSRISCIGLPLINFNIYAT